MPKRYDILPARIRFFISSAGTMKASGIHTETFRVAFQMTVMLKLDD